MDTTIDEARRCPKCKELGQETGSKRLSGGSREVTFACRNDRCKWHNEICSVVTIRADGSIPPPKMSRPKAFPAVADLTEKVQASLDRQLIAERSRENEIRGRY